MGRAYKNFWSLNTDEAVAVGILRDGTPRNIEVLMPLNAQMKGIDLVLINIKSKKVVTLQVKGSRAFEPRKSEVKRFGPGTTGFFFPKKETIINATADYFVFLIYVIEEVKKIGRRIIEPHLIVIPTLELKKLTLKYKILRKNSYCYYIWINPKKKEAFDFANKKYYLTKYLDKKGISIIKFK